MSCRYTGCSLSRSTPLFRAVLALLAAGLLPAVAFAQRGEPMTETRTGTLVEIEEKGRSRTLVVDVNGKQEEFPLTPRVALEITATGDAGFVDEGRYLSARGTVTNDQLFLRSVNILLLKGRQRPPAGGLKKAPMAVGESVNSWDIAGEIVGSEPDPDYPDYTGVDVKIGPRTQRVLLEPGFTVTVMSTDPTVLEIPPGTSIDLEGTPRGERFLLTGAKVRLSEPLTAAEFFAEDAPAGNKPAAEKPEAEKPETEKPETEKPEAADPPAATADESP